MKIEFEEWGEWSTAVESVALYGKVDGRRLKLAFSGRLCPSYSTFLRSHSSSKKPFGSISHS